jgi:hypothetical protein
MHGTLGEGCVATYILRCAMSTWADINYRGFWDVPRIFFVRHDGRLYLFDCAFDDEVEDYPETYAVYEMPELTDADYAGSWVHLADNAVRRLGEVPLDQVQFDPTKRRQINTAIFAALTPRPEKTPG